MVTRMKLSPADGFLMSRPGVDVTQSDTHRLMDPRFPSLEVHAAGGGDLNLYNEGSSRDDWERIWTFPDLGYIPIFMASATFTDQPDRIKYPATLPARVHYSTGGGIDFTYWNQCEITSSSIRLRIATIANDPRPNARWVVYKNARVMT